MKFIIFLPLFFALVELIPGSSATGKRIDKLSIDDFSIIIPYASPLLGNIHFIETMIQNVMVILLYQSLLLRQRELAGTIPLKTSIMVR